MVWGSGEGPRLIVDAFVEMLLVLVDETEVEVLRQRLAAAEAAMKAVASLPGENWLTGQLALAEFLDGKGGKHLQYALVMYRAAKGGRDE